MPLNSISESSAVMQWVGLLILIVALVGLWAWLSRCLGGTTPSAVEVNCVATCAHPEPAQSLDLQVRKVLYQDYWASQMRAFRHALFDRGFSMSTNATSEVSIPHETLEIAGHAWEKARLFYDAPAVDDQRARERLDQDGQDGMHYAIAHRLVDAHRRCGWYFMPREDPKS